MNQMRKNTNIAIIGYFGFNNAGDELMLRCLLARLRTFEGIGRIIAFSNVPKETTQAHGISAVAYHYNVFGAANFFHFLALLRSNIIIFCGGTFLQDYGSNSWKGIYGYLKLVLMATITRKKIVIVGAGAGPLATRIGRFLSKLLVNFTDCSVWRDIDSICLLEDIGCDPTKLQLGSDLLLTYRHLLRDIPRYKNKSNMNVALSFFNYFETIFSDARKSNNFKDEIVKLISELQSRGYKVHVFCMQSKFAGKDDEFAGVLTGHSLGVRIYNFFDDSGAFIAALNGMDYAIGMRYHFLLLCYVMKIPFIGINYNPKVKSLCHELGFENYCIDIDVLSEQYLMEKFDELIMSNIDMDIEQHISYDRLILNDKVLYEIFG